MFGSVGALFVTLGPGCGADSAKVGGETSFLLACDEDSDCKRGSCICQVCTLECDGDRDCDVMVGASCTSPLANAGHFECEQQRSICLPTPDPEEFSEPPSFSESYTAYNATLPVLGECEKDAPRVVLRVKEADDSSLMGEVWLKLGINTSPFQSLSGMNDDHPFVDATELEWAFGPGKTRIEEFNVALEAMDEDQLAGVLSTASIIDEWSDEISECALGGPLILQRDDTPPKASGTDIPISPSFSYAISFDDIVLAPVEVALSRDGEPVPFTTRISSSGTGFVQSVSIHPDLGWPAGEYTVSLGQITDIGNNETAAQTFSFPVSEYVSPTVDPSFEDENREGGWMLWECAVETSFSATFDGEPNVLQASDGEKFSLCEGFEMLFAAEVQPPVEATRVLIDVGAYWPNSSSSLPYPKDDIRRLPMILLGHPLSEPWGAIEMEPVEPASDFTQFGFHTFAATLPASGVYFSLSAIMLTPEDWSGGDPVAFFDNLRFE